MKPLRILMVVRLFYPWVGGTERQAHKLALKLREKAERKGSAVTVELVTGWWYRGTPQRETIDGLPIFRNQTLWEFFGISGLRKFGGYLYIVSLLWYLWRRRADYDLIHVHGFNYHTFAAVLAGRWFKRKVVAKLANSGRASDIMKMRQNQKLPLTRYMLPLALQCDRFVALNKTVVEELTAAGVPPQKIVALTNGVEIDQIAAKSCYRLHSPARLVYVGRFHKQKGVDVLLKAFHQLLQQYPAGAICLELLGDGPLRKDLLALAEGLGIRQQVSFLGQTDQVLGRLRQADIFVLPSRAEGISNALLEAMAVGLPAVVSNVPGNVDVIAHAHNGLLFAADDPDALAGRLKTLLDQADLRARLGRAARRSVENHYSLDYVADRYIDLYQTLLATEPTRSLLEPQRVGK